MSNVIFKNAIINLLAQLCFYGLSFLSIPLTLSFLGKESFGVFQTILTFFSWVSLANLGLGNGLRNKITEVYTKEGKNKVLRLLIGSAFCYSSLISVGLGLFFTIGIYYFFEPNILFNNLKLVPYDVKFAFIIAFLCFSFNITLSLFSSIAYGIHKSYLYVISQVLQVLLFLFFLSVLERFVVTRQIIWVVFIYCISSLIAQIFPLFFFLGNKKIWPFIFKFSKSSLKELSSVSIRFFFLQLATIVLFSSDNFIISKYLGASEVAEYSVSYRLYFLIISLFSMVLVQVWSSTTKAAVKGEYNWIKRIVLKLHLLLLPIIFLLVIISVCYKTITGIWVGNDLISQTDHLWYKFLFSVYVLLHCSNAIFVNMLNGLSRLKFQTIAYLIGAFFYFLFSYYFITILKMGLIGLLLGKIIFISLTLIICVIDFRSFLKNANTTI